MPIDEETRVALEMLEKLGMNQAYKGFSAKEVRERLAPLEAMRKDAGTPVASETDQVIPGPGGELSIRIYRPGADGTLPVIIYFHGGGFVLGGLDSHSHVCRELCNRVGAIVVSVDYRRAPEHKFPAAIDDAFAAVCWVAENIADLGGDAQRLVVAGDSAGANLATVTALRCRDENGPELQFQLLAYPGTDALGRDHHSRRENAEGYFLTEEAIQWFFEQYLDADTEKTHPWVSPLHAAELRGLPPALVITAEYDPLRDEGEAYAKRLVEAGVDARASRYDGTIHGFFGPATSKGQEALAEAAETLRQVFASTRETAEVS